MTASPFTSHPCLPPVTDAEIAAILAQHGEGAPAVLREIEVKRKELIAQAAADPLRHGWELEAWRDADRLLAQPETRILANLGGGGSSKTTWAVKRGVHTAFTVPKAKVLFLHEDEDASRDVHQAMAYEFLPPELKPVDGWKPKKTTTTNIVYDSKIGFSGNAFTTPIGGKARFGFYRQDIKRWEGGGWTLIIMDENAPLKWIETLGFRLGRAGGKLIWCFTAIDGITPAVQALTAGARTLESRRVDPEIFPADYRCIETQDWPLGHMPYIQQGVNPMVKIIYFHSEMNPLSGYDPAQGRGAFYGYNDQKLFCKGKPKAIAERRCYGFSRKSARSVFPLFGAVHVLPENVMRERLANASVTRYQIIDPAGARQFFMIWFAVDSHGRHFIYREWPDLPTYGEWALPADDPNKWDGKQGPAQAKTISGVVAYKRVILEAEGWRWTESGWSQQSEVWVDNVDPPTRHGVSTVIGESVVQVSTPAGRKTIVAPIREYKSVMLPTLTKVPALAEEIFDRYVDPRSGATEAMASDAGESSVIDRFREEQTDEQGRIVGPVMILTPATSGKVEEDGLTQIDELLAYNPAEPITALLNEPKLYISAACENTIWAMTNYTGHDGAKAACKDPIDCVRYMALKKCVHVQASALTGIAGGGW
jgi:hypothetical protein